ncbi:hypothetical protein K438DRAFT_1996622 [Mycena galopus ATCC 62051]|nr:hypothetical protein K438DRAFT_1996622 [Mycena galopus ATCC 62051]
MTPEHDLDVYLSSKLSPLTSDPSRNALRTPHRRLPRSFHRSRPLAVALARTQRPNALYYCLDRLQLRAHLTSQSQSALTPSRYLRFMGMVLTQMLWATFVTVANISFSSSPGHLPWVSWASVHSGFSLSVGQTLCV